MSQTKAMTIKLQNGPEILLAAIEGLEAKKLRIDLQIAELQQALPGGQPIAAPPADNASPSRKNKMSASARKRIAAAQKLRWANYHKSQAAEPEPEPAPRVKKKRRLSAAGRRAIQLASKRRWATVHKQQKTMAAGA